MYTGKSVSYCTAGSRRDVRTMQFAGFLFFTFRCYLAVHVKCTVYNFSDCIGGAAAVLSLRWPTRGAGPMSRLQRAAWVGGTKAAGQKNCDWSALTSCDWFTKAKYYDPSAVRLGHPACRSVQRPELGHHGTTRRLHLFMDLERKYIDLYT